MVKLAYLGENKGDPDVLASNQHRIRIDQPRKHKEKIVWCMKQTNYC